jgi:signal transduction histidine kinase
VSGEPDHERGEIQWESRWIGISAVLETLSGGGPVVKIEVRDRWTWIDEVDIDHVFEPFYRSPKVIARQIHGSGFGLSIANASPRHSELRFL